MSERLYYADSKLTRFEGTITETRPHPDGFATILNRTAFYPTSGGQFHDRGTLGGREVVDVVESRDQVIDGIPAVVHITTEPVGDVGSQVVGEIDTARRTANCQKHTAQHILSQVFVRLADLATVSVHLGEEYAAIELDTAGVSEDQLDQAERDANRIVRSCLPVEILSVAAEDIDRVPLRKQPTRTGRLRIIKIGDFEYSACGGTHCENTGEIGLIKIVGVEKMRGHALVKFLVGDLALADYGSRLAVTAESSKLLTCHSTEIAQKVSDLLTERKEFKRQLKSLQDELHPVRVRSILASARTAGQHRFVVGIYEDLDAKSAAGLARMAADEADGLAVIVTHERLFLATTTASGLDAGQVAAEVCRHADLRGGGKGTQAQIGGIDFKRREAYLKTVEQVLHDA